MSIEFLIKLLSSLGLLLIGIMSKFSINDGWSGGFGNSSQVILKPAVHSFRFNCAINNLQTIHLTDVKCIRWISVRI
jgi:hypothetical protein